ncbi:unnamed protein product, partial [Lymnaea stagnalis]
EEQGDPVDESDWHGRMVYARVEHGHDGREISNLDQPVARMVPYIDHDHRVVQEFISHVETEDQETTRAAETVQISILTGSLTETGHKHRMELEVRKNVKRRKQENGQDSSRDQGYNTDHY